MSEEIKGIFRKYAMDLRNELSNRIRGQIIVKYNEYSDSIYIRVICDENLMVEWSVWEIVEKFHDRGFDVDGVCNDVERALMRKVRQKYFIKKD